MDPLSLSLFIAVSAYVLLRLYVAERDNASLRYKANRVRQASLAERWRNTTQF